jgi:hypothetical protein
MHLDIVAAIHLFSSKDFPPIIYSSRKESEEDARKSLSKTSYYYPRTNRLFFLQLQISTLQDSHTSLNVDLDASK